MLRKVREAKQELYAQLEKERTIAKRAKEEFLKSRMRKVKDRKCCMCYPNDKLKVSWDILVTIVLIYSIFETPYTMAFSSVTSDMEESTGSLVFSYFIDCMFGADIIVSFISAYTNEEKVLIDDRKMVAKQYVSGWFVIDLIATLPFDRMIQG